jgi:hypothetical protein
MGNAGMKTPNSKLQTPEKLQIPNSKGRLMMPDSAATLLRALLLGIWILEFFWMLDVGVWSFETGRDSRRLP